MQNGRSVFYTHRSLPWWSLAVPGLIISLIGIYIFFQTENFIQLLTIGVGIFVLINGISTVMMAIRFKGDNGRRLATLVRGLLGIIIGVLALTLPFLIAGIAWTVMLTIVAIQLVLAAILEIFVAYRLRERGAPMGSAITSAIFSLLLAILLFYAPVAVGLTTLRFIAALILLFGLSLIGLGWRLRP